MYQRRYASSVSPTYSRVDALVDLYPSGGFVSVGELSGVDDVRLCASSVEREGESLTGDELDLDLVYCSVGCADDEDEPSGHAPALERESQLNPTELTPARG